MNERHERERCAAERLTDALKGHVRDATITQDDMAIDVEVTFLDGRTVDVGVIALSDRIHYRVWGQEHDILVTDDVVELAEWLGATPAGLTPLDALGLSTRPYNALRRGGIHSVEHLLDLTPRAVRAVRNVGDHSFREITHRLATYRAAHDA